MVPRVIICFAVKIALTILAISLVIIGFANFISFLNEEEHLGGDAINGYSKDGHFYVTSHGKSKEISEADWNHNKKHSISVIVTHPLLMLSMAYLMFQYLFPLSVYRGDRQAMEQHAASLSKSNLISSKSCGGRIGSFSGPLLRVQLFETGMIIHPLFMRRFGIEFSQIKSVDAKYGLLCPGVEIIHSSQQIQNPIILNCSPNDPFILRLQSLVKPT
jgi:hypothetical protein